jgi:hypothetical protein
MGVALTAQTVGHFRMPRLSSDVRLDAKIPSWRTLERSATNRSTMCPLSLVEEMALSRIEETRSYVRPVFTREYVSLSSGVAPNLFHDSGLISDYRGGCGTVTLVGSFTNFLQSSANGLTSTAFPSIFPLSYRITPATTLTNCSDMRNEALAFNIIITCMLFLLLRPKPVVLFWCLVCVGYWHISLFSDPAAVPPQMSTAFQTFLPSLFICYAFWRAAFRHCLPAFSELPLERAVWYLAPFWAGVLFNVVVAGIPIDRLVSADITERPGAMVALIVCCLVILALVINQIRVIRKTGWVPHYLKWYLLGALTLVVLACLPGLQFRLHHYFAAMLIIPLTAFPTRLSAIYQAFCLGMFLNGAAKFGLDSILQTADEVSIFGYF